MKKLVKYGLLLLVLSLIGLSILAIGNQTVYAIDSGAEKTEEEILKAKEAAIAKADEAIGKITEPIAYEQAFVRDVAYALSLVEIAREEHGAVDSDFKDLAKLRRAERKVLMFLAIKDAHIAIDALPSRSKITEEDREDVEEARRLINVAMYEHGATAFNMCWRLDELKAIEDIIGEPEEEEPEPEPEPKPVPPKPKPDDRMQTPPTGGYSAAFAFGLSAVGGSLLFAKGRKKGRH